MALTGMKYPVYAVVSAETEGSAITYGTGAVVGHAISATVTLNRRDNPLYADNVKVENDKGITDYSISLNVDDLDNETRAALLGEKAVRKSGDTVDHYEVIDNNPPYVGFGYLTNKIKKGVSKLEAYWFHKVQFALDNESANTKADSISWQTPTLTGTGFGVTIDNSGETKHYDHMNFDTEAAALAWLKAKANIT